MSSVLISWVIINQKYLLIYFADFDLDKKLSILDKHDFAFHCCGHYLPYANNFIFPILFGLFYVYVYPQISKKFYEYTLNRTKELKSIKQSIEDETPLTQAEAREIRKLASTLEEEKDKALKNLSKKDAEWQEKLDYELGRMNEKLVGLNSDVVAADVKIHELETERDTLQEELKSLQMQLSQSNQFLGSKNDECEQLKTEIDKLKKKLPVVAPAKLTLAPIVPKLSLGNLIAPEVDKDTKFANAYEKVMQYLHDDFDPMPEGDLIDKIVKSTNLGKTLVRHIIHTMRDDKILANNGGYIVMTKEGTAKVLDFIEKLESFPF